MEKKQGSTMSLTRIPDNVEDSNHDQRISNGVVDPHRMLFLAIGTVLLCLLIVLYFSFYSCKCV